jgi:hypothetical protein
MKAAIAISLFVVLILGEISSAQAQGKVDSDGNVLKSTLFPIPRVGEKWTLRIKLDKKLEATALNIIQKPISWNTYLNGEKSFYLVARSYAGTDFAIIYDSMMDPNNKFSHFWLVSFGIRASQVLINDLKSDEIREICDFPFFEFGTQSANTYSGHLYSSTVNNFDLADASGPKFFACELSKIQN